MAIAKVCPLHPDCIKSIDDLKNDLKAFKKWCLGGIGSLILIAVTILTYQATSPYRYADRGEQIIQQGEGAKREAKIIRLELLTKEIQDETTAQNQAVLLNQDEIVAQLARIIAEQIKRGNSEERAE